MKKSELRELIREELTIIEKEKLLKLKTKAAIKSLKKMNEIINKYV